MIISNINHITLYNLITSHEFKAQFFNQFGQTSFKNSKMYYFALMFTLESGPIIIISETDNRNIHVFYNRYEHLNSSVFEKLKWSSGH